MNNEKEKRLEDVFKTVGLPPYTYVKPAHYGEVKADILQTGKHLLIQGPSGIGKTCVVYKIFEELGYVKDKDYAYISCRDSDAEKRISAFFEVVDAGGKCSAKIFVIDDFHILPAQRRSEIGSVLKRLSDRAFEEKEPAKTVLIGIPTTGISLLSNALDLGPRLGSYTLDRATDTEIERLLSEGEQALRISFEDHAVLLRESNGNFWLAQYICNKICASQEIFKTQKKVTQLIYDMLGIRGRLMRELSQRYMPIAKSFAKGKKWRPGGNKPYLEILLALCKIPDSVVSFDKLLNVVEERRKPGIKAVKTRIPEVIFDPGKGTDYRQQIVFEPDAGFSIEDPLYRYFLTNLDVKDLFKELGIDEAKLENNTTYTWDIGFSFAGEIRPLVELVNEEMKLEDIVTFYDFDLQAFLLATDLQEALGKIYSESCRYYVVFLDKNYRDKVWTRFEKDVMTRPGRMDHIIPVIVDAEGEAGTVGISNSIGRIDFKDVWSSYLESDEFDEKSRIAIRNRCILPITEKLDEYSDVSAGK